jgi:pantothenate kinase
VPEELRAATADLVGRASALAARGARVLLGITGPPGAGKTTLAHAVVEGLGPARAVLVPMDGFHLGDPTLVAWGRRDRKGAPDTFDVGGYVALLRRLRDQREAYVHAPDFDRALEASLGSAIPVAREVPLVVTEGNYLLSDDGAWAEVGPLLDESWFIDVPDDVRVRRLVRRREGYGADRATALAWATGSDQRNADVVAGTRPRADLAVTLAGG